MRKIIRRSSGVALIWMLLCLTACGNATSSHGIPLDEAHATPPPGLSGPALDAWRVLHIARPTRDAIALAERLAHVAGPIPRVVRSAPLNRTVGVEETFWVQADDASYRKIRAKLVYITPHAYDYVEDGLNVDLNALHTSANTFENSIYPADRFLFGSEWSPGIDDDVHITLLNTQSLPGATNGYFSSIDELPAPVDPYSNEREMLYLNLGPTNLSPDSEPYAAALAHEFQQLIHWHQRPTDPNWLDEGMAVLAQHLNGYDTQNVEDAFMSQPATQLDSWTGAAPDAQYGAAYLFVDYFAEHFGGFGVLKELLADPAQAPLNFNDVLAAHGYTARFDDVFAQWVLANALNDEPSVTDDRFRYKTVAHKHITAPLAVTSLPFDESVTAAPQYAAGYTNITPAVNTTDQTLTLDFAGQPGVAIINAPMPPGAASIWWSNRGESMDTTLTHSFDLTRISALNVALTFSLWQHLGLNRDYGYVAVSADNGNSWQTVHLDASAADDPTGFNLGNGVTGSSATAGGSWRQESADLSPYIGRHILVRFEAVMDELDDQEGMAIANIAVPAIGFTDSGQDDAGWEAQGWLRTANVVPEHYSVQAAVFPQNGDAPVVQTMNVDTTGNGKLTIAHFGTQVGRVLLVIAPLAPATQSLTNYALHISGA